MYISRRAIVDISCIDMLVKNIRIKYLDIEFKTKCVLTSSKQGKALQELLRILRLLGVPFELYSCLLGVRARTSASKSKPLQRNYLIQELQMIVYTVSVAKNNNASLQSN